MGVILSYIRVFVVLGGTEETVSLSGSSENDGSTVPFLRLRSSGSGGLRVLSVDFTKVTMGISGRMIRNPPSLLQDRTIPSPLP